MLILNQPKKKKVIIKISKCLLKFTRKSFLYHEVSDSEVELINHQQREVHHLSAFLRAAEKSRKVL